MCCCNLCPNNPSSAELTAGAQQILVDSAKEGRKEGGDGERPLPQKGMALGEPAPHFHPSPEEHRAGRQADGSPLPAPLQRRVNDLRFFWNAFLGP